LAYHPPSASSRRIDPDEVVSTFMWVLSPSFITDQAPNCFSIIKSAEARASLRLSVVIGKEIRIELNKK
jgi:hypothetical protein